MKLAEALAERADIRRRMDQLASRMETNAKVQEGEKPAEDPMALLSEFRCLADRLEELVTQINLTNAATVSNGETLTAMLSRRDCLTIQVNTMRNFLDAASATVSRGLRSEIRILSTVDVQSLRKDADKLAKELRELDVRIQALNWTTELR